MRRPYSVVTHSTNTTSTDEETQRGAASRPDYENESVFQRNRLPPRSYHIPETHLLLNRQWDFNYAPSPAHAPEPKSKSAAAPVHRDHQKHDWAPIEVPGHWQLQGYGHPHYTNFDYPFPVCPPKVPTDNPTGTFRRTFSIPKDWPADSQLRLRFDGVDSAFHLWVNGGVVGYSQGSRNPSEFDVTKYVSRDESNDIFVRVYQWSDGSYIEDQG
jgi:beta-galactosidase